MTLRLSRNAAHGLLGLGLLLAGAGLLAGTALYRNALVQRAVSLVDLSDRACRNASVASGSACPSGCVARPARQPSDRYAPPECRSALWVATCGKACDPAPGLLRLPDGHLASSDALDVQLKSGSDAAQFSKELAKLGARSDANLSGLDRYRVTFKNPRDRSSALEALRRRLTALPGIAKIDYDLQ